ncbi:Golgi reassembly stacking protein (GRASP homologue), putative [Trypanosoma brucei gambiense DAL972]|uniref:Golgi reassembly stacking protein (GRASP homologue), putative n=1 Tax=Trypanosoma brucei gambiense (strain MHOM/CI/86/DAL972) TaxID=679716 RepID=D0A674_TRYB9|nr:Golgi reassembly stacking protein (GRASP homologue), putative [Trypanosoma brucei gambiense DAL972]CBH17175.1 Golgi reassembly stacking protein (GRASP homologue), putative [Trypanosoma brucei gambiense DAL972]|eukprot:XP_011779439.1 Golgi reassembly stacking protein (GRASP homologue), putative [Trypanosoma brucei gambiense DAL972]
MGQGKSDAKRPLKDIEGLQIVRVLPYSPSHSAGLIPFFDIITAVDGKQMEVDGESVEKFKYYVAGRRDETITLTVYNLYIHNYRDVHCVASSTWGGGGLLGCSVEWCQAEKCVERCWHVVDVIPGSPVAKCGEIKEGRDYIIGIQKADELVTALIKDEDDLYTRVELWRTAQSAALRRLQRNSFVPTGASREDRGLQTAGQLLLLVYDSVNIEVKEVLVDFGNDIYAPLGMNLATGLLHLIPSPPKSLADNGRVTGTVGISATSAGDDSSCSVNSSSNLPTVTAFVLATGGVLRIGKTAPTVLALPKPGATGSPNGPPPPFTSPVVTEMQAPQMLPEFPSRVHVPPQKYHAAANSTAFPKEIEGVHEQPPTPLFPMEGIPNGLHAPLPNPAGLFMNTVSPRKWQEDVAAVATIPAAEGNPSCATTSNDPPVPSYSAQQHTQQQFGLPFSQASYQQQPPPQIIRQSLLPDVTNMVDEQLPVSRVPPPLAFPIIKPATPSR